MAGDASRQNGKKGGRPKGSKNAATLEKEAVLAEFRGRVMKTADKLFNAQMTRAQGMTFLYKIEKYWEGAGENRILKQRKPKQVTNSHEIEAYLEGLINEGDVEDRAPTYYFITTTPPDSKAIDSMLDRAFGKSSQRIELVGDPDAPLEMTVKQAEAKAAKILGNVQS